MSSTATPYPGAAGSLISNSNPISKFQNTVPDFKSQRILELFVIGFAVYR